MSISSNFFGKSASISQFMKEEGVLMVARKSSYTMEQYVKAIFNIFIVPLLLHCFHIIAKFFLRHNSRPVGHPVFNLKYFCLEVVTSF